MLAMWPRLNQIVRRRVASMTEAPPCAVCGRGHASTGWHVDPMGGTHGLCPGCVPDDPMHPPLLRSRKPEL
jgi:hypothetical protein